MKGNFLMQVTNVQSQTNFNGIYRIKNTPENVKLIKENVAPMYSFLRKESIGAFPGNNPLIIGLEFIMEKLAKSNQASKDWLILNAKNFGTKIPNLNKDYLYVISSNKDLNEFVDFITKRMNTYKESPFQKVINFFKGFTQKENSENLPEHIQILNKSIEIFDNETIEYQKFLSKKKIIDVSTPQELLAKMLLEK